MASKKSSKQVGTIALASVAAITIGLVAWAAVMNPQVNRIGTANDKASAQIVTNADLVTQVKALQEKKKNLPLIQDAVTAFSQSFPPGSDQQTWIGQLSEAATNSGVSILSIAPTTPAAPAAGGVAAPAAAAEPAAGPSATGKPSSTAVDGSLAVITVSLSVSGSDAALRVFLTQAQSMKRPLLIDTLSISGDTDAYTAVIAGKTFLTRGLADPGAAPVKKAAAAAPDAMNPTAVPAG